MKYKISEYAKLNHVTYRTVWNWIKDGKLDVERTSTGRIQIVIDDAKEQVVAIYARVSSSENKDNLDRQAQRLIDYCNAKGYRVQKIVKEVGSGLNDKRKKLQSILMDRSINLIVVEHKDRFCRFGMNYIETLLEMDGRKIEVVNSSLSERDDLMSDFVSIITSFCSRLYGLRRSKRNTEKLIEALNNETSGDSPN